MSIPSHVHHVEDDLKHVIVMNSDNGQIFALDNSAAVIWGALAATGSAQAAIEALVETYRISSQRAADDVREFVARLVGERLLVAGDRDV